MWKAGRAVNLKQEIAWTDRTARYSLQIVNTGCFMARLMPVLTCLFWMVAFAAAGLMAITADESTGNPTVWSALLLPAIAGAAALGFGWVAMTTATLPAHDCTASDLPPYQMVFAFALVVIGAVMLTHLADHGFCAIVDGCIAASGLIASFLLVDKSIPDGEEASPATLPARQASHLVALANAARSDRREGKR